MDKGCCTSTMPHDDKHHGTTPLFAALKVRDGQITDQTSSDSHGRMTEVSPADRSSNFPKDKTLHLIADNGATRKHPNAWAWLDQPSRFHRFFTLTLAS
ncbi:MAG TPA: hypothetical protein PKN13_05325 [Accumulibacter sp.]|nr:hypothetical protein [Accumulibacter sp.]HMW17627.1 hypothetical protein [Accumulibacter sp.]HMX21739.1 hypothetical protein [Accumulibacter sp.]HMY05509.1 hypothetical protein [Accumulibacter sp.]HNC18302.1 hypothetical protein [Accumulibacter sp.]